MTAVARGKLGTETLQMLLHVGWRPFDWRGFARTLILPMVVAIFVAAAGASRLLAQTAGDVTVPPWQRPAAGALASPTGQAPGDDEAPVRPPAVRRTDFESESEADGPPPTASGTRPMSVDDRGGDPFIDSGPESEFSPHPGYPPGQCGCGNQGGGSCGGGCGGNCGSGCGSGCGDDRCCACPCLQGRLEVRAEYLLWWAKGDPVPPLVTTSPADTSRADAGVLGQPGTSILFGDSDLNDQTRSGGRFTADYWFGCDHCLGIEAGYLFLGDHTDSYQNSSDGTPILARPFYNIQTASEDAGLIAYPGVQTGSINIADRTEFDGAEVLLRSSWFRQCGGNLDFLLGYRYLRLADNLQIGESETSTDTEEGAAPVGTQYASSDGFRTLNQFNGADLGADAQWHCCGWSLDLLMKLGLGNTNSHVSVNGATTITEPGAGTANYPGGFLAQQSNIGNYSRNDFAVVPELGATVGYDLTCRLRLTLGYTFLFWSSVARPGDQIDTTLNPSQFPPGALTGVPAPQFKMAMTDYWAQGVNLGLDFRF
jgi:hypothetical protein